MSADAQPAFFDEDSIVAAGSSPKLIARQFAFTEGAAVDKAGNVYFTDQPRDQIWKYGTDGKLSLFMDKTRRSNGMYIDAKGNILSCADQNGQIIAIGQDKKIKVLTESFNGRQLNGPNDLWLAPNGDIYFTDPYYQRDYWTRKAPDLEGQHVYLLQSGKKDAIEVATDLKKPNGIVGTPDGKYLFVSDIEGNKTYKYSIGAGGHLQNRQLFVDQGSDGITLDDQGNLYLTGKGVIVYNTQGKKIAHIPIPENWTGNLCFAGAKRDQLFITASEGIYILPMRVKGVE